MPEKKEKVLIVHNYYQIPGGEDTVVENEKKLLEKHGHEVVLYTRHNSELKGMSKSQKLLLPFSTIFNLKTYREVRRIIEEQNINVLHVHNTLNLISPSVYYAGFSKKIPVVQTVHNFRLLCPGATFFRDGHVCEECLEKGLSCAIKHSCYRGSKVQTFACVISTWIHRVLGTYGKLNYICLTEFNKSKLLYLKQVKKEKVFVKPNFVQAEKEVVSYEERDNQFIYVGRLEEIKGIDVLLNAWKLLGKHAHKLYVCGKGPLEDWAKEFVHSNHLENVKLLGFVQNDQVKELIGKSKALILPTKVYEGFPMTIAESYAAGTPVIGSDLGNTGSLIENGKTGLKFKHTSAESLAETVMTIQKEFNEFPQEFIGFYSEESNYQMMKNIYETIKAKR